MPAQLVTEQGATSAAHFRLPDDDVIGMGRNPNNPPVLRAPRESRAAHTADVLKPAPRGAPPRHGCWVLDLILPRTARTEVPPDAGDNSTVQKVLPWSEAGD